MAEPVLSVHDLVVRYRAGGLFARPSAPAVDGVSLTIQQGETLGIVGESGSGKSSLLRAILRLVPVESGSIRLAGADWLALSGKALRGRRGEVGVVAQNPYLSLSPRLTIADIIAEPMQAQGVANRAQLRDRAAELLGQCGLPADFLR
ncbi:MAG: ATP-binding cassette domain-containing protein, partial [Pseudorhodoplanes sp.]